MRQLIKFGFIVDVDMLRLFPTKTCVVKININKEEASINKILIVFLARGANFIRKLIPKAPTRD